MKILCMDWMTKFECIGGACPLTCCRDWDIPLKKQEIESYKKMDHLFAKESLSMIDQEKKCMKMHDGCCAALTEDGWCKLVLECGSEALCATCTYFPRRMKKYGDIGEGTAEISCPVAAGYLLEPDVIEFAFAEEQTENNGAAVDYQIYDSLSFARTYLIELVQAVPGQYTCGKMHIIFSVLYQIMDLCQQNQLKKEKVEKLLHIYDSSALLSEIFTKCETFAQQYEWKAAILQKILIQSRQMLVTHIFPMLYERFSCLQKDLETWVSDPQQFATSLEGFTQYRNQRYPMMYDHYLVYILFSNWISLNLDQFGQFIIARVVEWSLFQIFAMSVWKEKGIVEKEEFEVIIAWVDRVITRSKDIRDELNNFVKELGEHSIANLLMLMI